MFRVFRTKCADVVSVVLIFPEKCFSFFLSLFGSSCKVYLPDVVIITFSCWLVLFVVVLWLGWIVASSLSFYLTTLFQVVPCAPEKMLMSGVENLPDEKWKSFRVGEFLWVVWRISKRRLLILVLIWPEMLVKNGQKWAQQDSNLRPRNYEFPALTTAPWALKQ